MKQQEYMIKDIYGLKEALRIALEVAYCDLGVKQIESIKMFIKEINEKNKTYKISDALHKDLLICLHIFKTSKTWFWLKEDFKKTVNDFLCCLK